MSSDIQEFKSNGKYDPYKHAAAILQSDHFAKIRGRSEFYIYKDGIYIGGEAGRNSSNIAEEYVKERVINDLKEQYSRQKLNKVFDIIKSQTKVEADNFGADPRYICLENGVYDIKNRELQPHSPIKEFRNKVPITYDKEAEPDKSIEFIEDVVQDSDVDLIQELFGYLLYRGYPVSRAFMFLGEGGNGKTTLFELMERFLGVDNVGYQGMQNLLDDRFARAELEGKMLNYDDDMSAKTLKDPSMFKKLTGGTKVSAQKKHQDPFKLQNTAKLVFAANDLPRTYDDSRGFFRRWILIDFPHRFTADDDGNKDKDPEIVKKITTEEELSGLLNWALEGLHRLLDNDGFSTDGHADDVKQKWVSRSDTITGWIEDQVEYNTAAEEVPKSQVFQEYVKWCIDKGFEADAPGTFWKRFWKLVPASKGRPTIDGERVRVVRDARVESWHGDASFDIDGKIEVDEAIIEEVEKRESDGGADMEVVIHQVASRVGTSTDNVESVIETMKGEGELYEPKGPGQLAVL